MSFVYAGIDEVAVNTIGHHPLARESSVCCSAALGR